MNRIDRVLVTLLLLFTLAVFGSAAALAGQAPEPEGRVRADAPTAAVQPSTQSKSAPAPDGTASPPELFFVRPEGAKGPLVAYDMSDGREYFTLPAGMLSADGQHYYAAHTLMPSNTFPLNMLPANGWTLRLRSPLPSVGDFAGQAYGAAMPPPGSTRLDAFDSGTGNLERSFVLDDDWALSGVSPSGRWLALTRIAAPLRLPPSERGEGEGGQAWASPPLRYEDLRKAGQWKTSIQIVDADSGQVVHVLNLDGNFEVETISADGKSLFLVQHLPAVNPDHYLIRLYDLSREQLLVDPLRAKGADEVMAGLAWDGIASPDGRWLLTLYLSTRRNVAFIHALNLHDKYPVCLDLPSGNGDPAGRGASSFDLLKHYTIALSPDGRKAYATNPVLGVVAEVGLNQLQVMRAVTFDAGIMTKYAPGSSRSLVSKDGRALYFSSGPVLWRYDIASRTVSAPQAVSAPIVGLGLSGDDQRLYVAGKDGSLMILDAATGQVLSLSGTEAVHTPSN
ncbi:MAG TPA: PQQ-binding-like beta-propeller repeat protein [Anaerolineae bacterium]|nr:PQQ-binding-like beta-propeller repeat protein [Anaerolineae bacterium]